MSLCRFAMQFLRNASFPNFGSRAPFHRTMTYLHDGGGGLELTLRLHQVHGCLQHRGVPGVDPLLLLLLSYPSLSTRNSLAHSMAHGIGVDVAIAQRSNNDRKRLRSERRCLLVLWSYKALLHPLDTAYLRRSAETTVSDLAHSCGRPCGIPCATTAPRSETPTTIHRFLKEGYNNQAAHQRPYASEQVGNDALRVGCAWG